MKSLLLLFPPCSSLGDGASPLTLGEEVGTLTEQEHLCVMVLNLLLKN